MFFVTLAFIKFPKRDDALISNNIQNVIVSASGSLGFLRGDSKCIMTTPNNTINESDRDDWCSNVEENGIKPWVTYQIKNKALRLTGYTLRNGCCHHHICCCDSSSGKVIDLPCCCDLYSFSLQGSNDNQTWKSIHKVEKEAKFYHCSSKTYDFEKTDGFRYVRLVFDEEYPGCPKCYQINQIELYGETVDAKTDYSYEESDATDESVSIIGKIHRI